VIANSEMINESWAISSGSVYVEPIAPTEAVGAGNNIVSRARLWLGCLPRRTWLARILSVPDKLIVCGAEGDHEW